LSPGFEATIDNNDSLSQTKQQKPKTVYMQVIDTQEVEKDGGVGLFTEITAENFLKA
jgi:hypothetical protein